MNCSILAGFDVDRALARIALNFLAPEYPFDGGACFALEPGTYTLHLDLVTEPRVNARAFSHVRSCWLTAARSTPQRSRPFDSLPASRSSSSLASACTPVTARWQLRLDRPGAKSFVVSIAKADTYALFLQGLPETLTATTNLATVYDMQPAHCPRSLNSIFI